MSWTIIEFGISASAIRFYVPYLFIQPVNILYNFFQHDTEEELIVQFVIQQYDDYHPTTNEAKV